MLHHHLFQSQTRRQLWLTLILLLGLIWQSGVQAVVLAQDDGPSSAEEYAQRGQGYLETGDYEAALADFAQAIHLDEGYATAYTLRGEAYRLMERYQLALSSLEQAIQLNPKDPQAFAVRGVVQQQLGQDEEALADLDHAIELNPQYGWAYKMRGKLHEALHNYDQAEADLSQAKALAELDPASDEQSRPDSAEETNVDSSDTEPEFQQESNQPQPTHSPIMKLTDVYSAVVEIRVFNQGDNFQTPSGTGSGFVIDPSGIMVTNVHVIGEAAAIEVRFAHTTTWLPAKIVAVNECQDLAVLDIAGEGYDYLTWSPDLVQVGQKVYGAGFPRSAEYTVTEGIFSREEEDGETDWASLAYVLRHTAHLEPGNSGGPLVDAQGRVVGVNYAGNETLDLNFAIPRDLAEPMVAQLQQTGDAEAIGISGRAINYEDGRMGIRVNAVRSGTPADQAEIQAGDVIVFLEGRRLAEDGTMREYCRVLRGHTPDDVLDVVLWRQAAIERLEGQLNGRALSAEGFSVLGWGYEPLADLNEIITIIGPVRWTDRDGGQREILSSIRAFYLDSAPDLPNFWKTWDVPGVSVNVIPNRAGEVSDQILTDLLDHYDYAQACTYDGRSPLSLASHEGFGDTWLNCGGSGTALWMLALTPSSSDYLVVVQAQLTEVADETDLLIVLNTLKVVLPPAPKTRPLTTTHFIAEIPADWSEDKEQAWQENGETPGQIVTAAPDIAHFEKNFLRVPGMQVRVDTGQHPQGDTYTGIDHFDPSEIIADCQLVAQGEHSHAVDEQTYTGAYTVWSDCQPGIAVYILSATNEAKDQSVLIIYVTANEDEQRVFAMLGQGFSLIQSDENGGQDDNTDESDTTLRNTPEVTVTVSINSLNVRNGPSTDYDIISAAQRDERLAVIGKKDAGCSWVKIEWPDSSESWVAGTAQYINFIIGDCDEVEIVPSPPLPPQGCYNFRNYRDTELTITITSWDGHRKIDFQVPRGGTARQCFEPDRYTYTISTPFDAVSGVVTIGRGNRTYTATQDHLPELRW